MINLRFGFSVWMGMMGVLLMSRIQAAPPVNDAFSSAVDLVGIPVSGIGTNIDATLQPDETLPREYWGEYVEASIWYRWISPTNGPVRVDTFGSDFDTILAVYTGNGVTNLTEISSGDDSVDSSQSAVYFDAVSDVEYWIAIYGYQQARGTVQLSVTNDTSTWITGVVTGPGATPLEGVSMSANSWGGDWWYWKSEAFTDAEGHYSIRGLPAGTYRVGAYDPSGDHIELYYDEASDLDSATDIVLGVDTNQTGIDLTLPLAGKISGTVTGPNGLTPVEGIEVIVQVWNDSWSWWETVGTFGKTTSSGIYTVGGLVTGIYRIEFLDPAGDYAGEFYIDAPDIDAATDISVSLGTTTTGIDSSLAAAAKITGTLTGPDGSTPLASLQATAYTWNGSWWDWVSSANTDATGFYSIGGLRGGTYRVEFYDYSGGYIYEVWNDVSDLESGQDIVVSTGGTTSGIDASLATASKISGHVFEPDGVTPIQNVQVTVKSWNGSGWDWINSDNTDFEGSYTVRGLSAGTFRVFFQDNNGLYASEAYDDAPDMDHGADIVVGVGTTVSGIDAILTLGAQISGTLTAPDESTPLQYISISAYTWRSEQWEWAGSAQTDAFGNFTIGGLLPGTYRVDFYDYSGGYIYEVWNDVSDLESGQDIVVSAGGTTSGIDASLAYASRITGTVTGPDGMTPAEGVTVWINEWGGSSWNSTFGWDTDASGNYTITDLSPGTYRVTFVDRLGRYFSEAYDDVSDVSTAQDITVGLNETIGGINASLVAAPPPQITDLGVITDAGGLEMHFTGTPGTLYMLEKCTNLTAEGWDFVQWYQCSSGTNNLPLTSSESVVFWRIRTQ